MRNTPWRLALTVLSLITLHATQAAAQDRLRGLVRFGGELGGDKVLQFQYSDGSTPDVPAGGGVFLAGGAAVNLFQTKGQALDVEGSVGVKYRTIPPAANQNATWMRFPVEGLLVYRAPFGLRAGGGVSMHFANVLEADGAVLNDRVEFKSTPGYVLQTGFGRGRWALDVRYTVMKYEVSGGGTGTVDANSIGAGLQYLFGG